MFGGEIFDGTEWRKIESFHSLSVRPDNVHALTSFENFKETVGRLLRDYTWDKRKMAKVSKGDGKGTVSFPVPADKVLKKIYTSLVLNQRN